MNRLLKGANLEPLSSNKWEVSGPFLAVELALADTGGWDLTGDTGVKREHFGTLHLAQMRAYNLCMGYAKQAAA